MVSSISQRQLLYANIAPQDITTQRTGAYVDASGAQRILGALNVATVAQTKTATIQLMQAQDASGTNAKTLGSAVTVTAPTGGAPLAPVAEAKAEDLDTANGFTFVAVQAVSNNASAVNGSAVLLLADRRYRP